MKLERVSSVSVCDLIFKSLREVNDVDSLIRTSLDAHTATDAKGFGDKANLAIFGDLDTKFALLVDGACLGALERALLGFTLVRVDDCDSKLVCVHFIIKNNAIIIKFNVFYQ